MSHRGVDISFRLGDRDLATCLQRTAAIRAGATLSSITADNHPLARRPTSTSSPRPTTRCVPGVRIGDGSWLPFQEYFVIRGNRGRSHRRRLSRCCRSDTCTRGDRGHRCGRYGRDRPLQSTAVDLADPRRARGSGCRGRRRACRRSQPTLRRQGPQGTGRSGARLARECRRGPQASSRHMPGSSPRWWSTRQMPPTRPSPRTKCGVLAADTRMTTAAEGARFAAWLMDTMSPMTVHVFPITGIPEVTPGDDVACIDPRPRSNRAG